MEKTGESPLLNQTYIQNRCYNKGVDRDIIKSIVGHEPDFTMDVYGGNPFTYVEAGADSGIETTAFEFLNNENDSLSQIEGCLLL